MTVSGFPTSSDIYLEVNATKVAIVQNYKATATRSETVVEAFGESEPVATLATQMKYRIVLTRLYATDEAISDGIRFHELEDFSLVIVKPDRRVVYTGCQWSEIQETGELGEMVAEKVTLTADRRMEIAANA